MTPTLAGRWQTRLFLVVAVGIPWTLAVTPLLTALAPISLGDAYRMTLLALAVMTALGLGWDCAYFGLQQFRWDKDWPTAFGLLNGFNEGATTWVGLGLLGALWGFSVHVAPFSLHFATTWLLMWLAAQGPMKVVLLRWRFRGARVLN